MFFSDSGTAKLPLFPEYSSPSVICAGSATNCWPAAEVW